MHDMIADVLHTINQSDQSFFMGGWWRRWHWFVEQLALWHGWWHS